MRSRRSASHSSGFHTRTHFSSNAIHSARFRSSLAILRRGALVGLALSGLAESATVRAQCLPGGELTIVQTPACPGTSDSVHVSVEGLFSNLCFSPLQLDSSHVDSGGLWIYATEVHAGYQGCFQAILEYQMKVPFGPLPAGMHPVHLEVTFVPLYDSSEYEGTYSCTASVSIYSPGDLTLDGVITLPDALGLVNYIFKGAPAPVCGIADVNCDGVATSADILYLIRYAFKSGPPPPPWCD